MENRIEDALIAIGIPINIFGFTFIKEAVLILDRDGVNVKWMDVYAEIAKKYGKTVVQVEKAIRHALEVARKAESGYDIVNHYIGFTILNNASSISLLYRMIKREMEKEDAWKDIKYANGQPVIAEEQVKKIVRETIKEMLGELHENSNA